MKAISTLLLLLITPIFASSQIIQTNVETLDQVEKTFKRWGGKEENIVIKLLETTNLDTDAKEKSIIIEIKSSESEVSLSSLSFGSIGGFGGSNIGLQVDKEEYQAFFTINPKYYDKIKKYLNSTLFKKKSAPQNDFSYNLILDNRFNLSLVYNKASTTRKYKYVMRLDDAWFTISFDEGISLLKKLIDFQDKAVQ